MSALLHSIIECITQWSVLIASLSSHKSLAYPEFLIGGGPVNFCYWISLSVTLVSTLSPCLLFTSQFFLLRVSIEQCQTRMCSEIGLFWMAHFTLQVLPNRSFVESWMLHWRPDVEKSNRDQTNSISTEQFKFKHRHPQYYTVPPTFLATVLFRCHVFVCMLFC